MVAALQVANMLLAALVVTTSLAHALELPGKMRLAEEAYLQTQTIYYPGFTLSGLAEPLVVVTAAVEAYLVAGEPAFAYVVTAVLAFAVVHGIYWLVTHPVNKVWLKDFGIGRAGQAFFEAGRQSATPEASDWRALRDRWERSHVARAVAAVIGLAALAVAAVL
jgi:hypothetical protein